MVTNIASQLVKTGKVTNSDRAYLGIEIADTAGTNGVYVSQVLPDTAAAKAGLKAGELITAVNGTATPSSNAPRHRARGAEAGPDGARSSSPARAAA